MGDELDLTADGGVYLTPDGGVLKTIIRKANTDAIGPTKDLPVVYVHYEGSLAETGEVIYYTREDEIQSFEVGANRAIKGLDIAVSTMKVGEIATITCKPDYAFGSEGVDEFPLLIPPNATLTIRVELMACEPRDSPSLDYSSKYIASLKKLGEKKNWTAARDAWVKKMREGGIEGVIYELMARERRDSASFRESSNYIAGLKKLGDENYWSAVADERAKKKREAEVEGVAYDLTGDGGVTKEIIKKAKAEDAIGPTEGLRIVDVRCYSCDVVTGTGETFPWRYEEHPIFTFAIGMSFSKKGWDIALSTMRVGDIAKITCKPEYAYGKDGCPLEIPPDATLKCELELVACNPCTSSIPDSTSNDEARVEWGREWGRELENWKALTPDELLEQSDKGAKLVAAAARVQAKLAAKKNLG